MTRSCETGQPEDWRRFNDIKKKPRDYAKKHTTVTSQTCSKMITLTILSDFGASLRAKEQRVQGWRL